MLTCPHFGQQTAIPAQKSSNWIDAGRFTCEHRERESLVAGHEA
jgi:hypothetical protein